MDLSYVDGKVREALVASRGSRAMAQKLLIQAALKDERLLQGLAAPFIKAIVGAAIERVARRVGLPAESGAAPRQQPQAQPVLSGEALDAVLGQMGRNAPGGAPDRAAVQSQAARILGGKPAQPQAGARHEMAMRTIAAAFKKKG